MADKIKQKHRRGAVRCIETGEVYKSASAAAFSLSRTLCAMSNHLNGRAPHLSGYHFEYVETPPKTP